MSTITTLRATDTRVYGESVVAVREDEEVAYRMSLRAWCETRACVPGDGELEVKESKKAELLSEKRFILEHQMASLHEDVKARFTAARYMDDILLLTAKGDWDSERFHADFQASECYMPPLKLEAGSTHMLV